MDDGPQLLPLPPALDPEPISRPSSTSTQASAAQNIQQSGLPGIAALATASQAASIQQPRPVAIAPAMYPQGTSPASTHPGPGGNLPTCQNCQTSTTPLWRRDEMGAVLCNACGLFLKLHGRPRPISLKTDVIKSRNRVKTMRPDLAKQKKQNQGMNSADMNGADYANQTNGAAAANARRASQRSVNGTHDDTNSPISRTGTPNMYTAHQIYPNIDEPFQTQHLPNFGVAGASPGRAPSPLNGELSRDHEQLIADNSSLKTRVSELEVIQELYRGRIQQLEQEETARQQAPDATKTEEQLHSQVAALTDANLQLQQQVEESRKQLDESHRRENMLKRRLDELEIELKNTKESLESYENSRAKKPRLDDGTAAPAEVAVEIKPDVA